MPSDQNPDREKLLRALDPSGIDGRHLGANHAGLVLHPRQAEAIADAILASEWLRARDERVRREAAAEQREKDMALIRWLANGRRRYQHTPDKQITPSSLDYPIYLQAKSVEQVADMIEGTNDACGWLHSADWDTWAAIREQGNE
jgi:hypothetical protein